jgi:hypothetical protein
MPIKPLHARIPEAVADEPKKHALFACLDAIRGGRARESKIAVEQLVELAGLPRSMIQ